MTLNDQLEQVRSEIGKWQSLLDSEQYTKLTFGLREQIRARQGACYGLIAHSLDALIAMGGINAEIVGIESALSYPKILIEDLRIQERNLLEQMNEH
jgi:hypothetical protein